MLGLSLATVREIVDSFSTEYEKTPIRLKVGLRSCLSPP